MGRGRPWGIFFGFYKTRHIFPIQRCKLHRAMCRRFDTIMTQYRRVTDRQTDRQTDGQMDGIAVANTALAMQALLRAVKTV